MARSRPWRSARRDDDRRLGMAPGDAGGGIVPVVRAIAGERRHGARRSAERGADPGAVVASWPVGSEATVRPVSASRPGYSVHQARLALLPCFSTDPSPGPLSRPGRRSARAAPEARPRDGGPDPGRDHGTPRRHRDPRQEPGARDRRATVSSGALSALTAAPERPPAPRRGIRGRTRRDPGAGPTSRALNLWRSVPRSRGRPSRKGPGLSPAPRRRPPSRALRRPAPVGAGGPARQASMNALRPPASRASACSAQAAARCSCGVSGFSAPVARAAPSAATPAAVRMSVRLRTSGVLAGSRSLRGARHNRAVSPGFRQCGSASTSRCRRCARRAGIR